MKYVFSPLLLSLSLFCQNSQAQEESIQIDLESFRESILSSSKIGAAQINAADFRDLAILENYLAALPSLDSREKEFLSKVLMVMKKFRGKPLDIKTEVSGDVDGDGEKDLIENHIYESNGVINVESFWRRNKEILWDFNLKDPYLWIGPSALFAYDTRDIWVAFTIAIYDAIPMLYKPSYFSHIQEEMIIRQGIEDLAQNGIRVKQKEYRVFLENYRGLILEYGEPEAREGLYIWYQPAKKFITFYHP